MHIGNSYLGLQQQIACCNAPAIKELAPSVDSAFPSLSVSPEQRTEQCQVQKTKNEEQSWVDTRTHSQTQLIT